MSAEARANGWRGFDGLARRTEGGYSYGCDGMPTPMGCGRLLLITRPLARVGKKKASGWLVCYGTDFDGTEDRDVVLTFCPECAAVVEAQAKQAEARLVDDGGQP